MSSDPYTHSGTPYCHYDEQVSESELEESNRMGDNEVVIDGDKAVVYEAPAGDDPNRGHFSEWARVGDTNEFEKDQAISGDVGMCYEKYQNAVESL